MNREQILTPFCFKKCMITDLIPEPLQFNYNPFGGLSDRELNGVLLPDYDLSTIADQLRTNRSIIEFVGKKGRGKTSHLRMLSYLLPEAELLLLDRRSTAEEINHSEASILLIDSIHHLSLVSRNKLFKQNRSLLFTTHHSKRLELFLAGQSSKSYYFKGIDAEKLQTILKNRIEQAIPEGQSFTINTVYLNRLIKKHGDHYRGIINELYHQFQQLNYEQFKSNL